MRGQETSGLAWVFKLQTLFEINQTKKNNNPKKLNCWGRKKAGGRKLYSPVMAKSYVTNYQHFLYSTHRETIKILLSQITKKVDTNNVCSGQISTHVACFSLRVLKQTRISILWPWTIYRVGALQTRCKLLWKVRAIKSNKNCTVNRLKIRF